MRGREARQRPEDALATGMIAGVTAFTAIGSRISSDYDSAWFRAPLDAEHALAHHHDVCEIHEQVEQEHRRGPAVAHARA